jgi:multisubunit Na+/H+ antiporter MnhB subunit
MPIESWLIYTLGIMLLGSIVALEIRDILSAIIAIGIVGLAVSAAFLFLQAPDLAIVQFLFEIFALVILVRAFIGKKAHADTLSIHKVYAVLVALALVAFFFLFTPVFRSLPPFGDLC